MSARHHLRDYDRGRAVARLEASKSVTTIAAAMSESKECHLAIKEGRRRWKCFEKSWRGSSLVLRFVTNNPAAENALSASIDVGGIVFKA
ncbi:hypothetical protein TNCV_2884971 [Trichonephila clavipes]|nr:hypothetical protein TNCV_2884971 [Trichonephila clavipes]